MTSLLPLKVPDGHFDAVVAAPLEFRLFAADLKPGLTARRLPRKATTVESASEK